MSDRLPYEQLSRAGQTRRLRELAEVALQAYAIDPVRLTRMPQGWNTTFRVHTADGERYALRVHRLDGPTSRMVRSELAWLAALRRKTDLGVPEPLPTAGGDLITIAATEHLPDLHTCDVLRWVEGRFVDEGLTPEHLARIGAFMARLHSSNLALPDDFDRGLVDHVSSFGRVPTDGGSTDEIDHAADLVQAVHSPRGAKIIRGVLERARAARESIGRGPDVYGLIHADLHHENVLFKGSDVRAIDFDDCGFGPFAYDLAVTLSELVERSEYAALRSALLAGYRSERPLDPGHERLLDTFIALRRVQLMKWTVEHRTGPMFRDTWQADVTWTLGQLEGFLEA